MCTVDELLYQRLRDAAGGAFEGLPVLFAYLFGSVVSDRAHSDSDVDVAVYLEPGVSSDRFLDLSLEVVRRLSEASGVGQIDILVLNEASLPILGRVVRTRAILYSRDEPARVRFESRTLREFFDYEFHSRPLDEKFLRDTAEGRR
jgi:predicted nucleotidyltransferase